MSRWTRANPLAAVPGYKVPRGHFANGYTNGGDRVGFKSGGRAGFKHGKSERYKKMMKEKAKIREGREVRDVKGKVISVEKRPHSTYAGRGAERRRGYLRKNKMLPGQANEKKRIQIRPKVSDKMQSLRDNLASVTGGEWGKKSGGRIGLKKGKSSSEKSTHPSFRYKHTPKQPHGRHSPGNIKALRKAWGRTQDKKPHSTAEGRHATSSRKFGRVLREAAGMKKGGWIQKAVNPKHKGFCTPMTKKTCTPRRKALAKTFKKWGRARKGKA